MKDLSFLRDWISLVISLRKDISLTVFRLYTVILSPNDTFRFDGCFGNSYGLYEPDFESYLDHFVEILNDVI